MQFNQLNIIEPILKAINEEGYSNPTPIQENAIPIVLDGSDLLAVAQTGTGKTAAFAIPIIQLLTSRKTENQKRKIKALILTPTRELAIQIRESFRSYGKYTNINTTAIFGGVKQQKQVAAISAGIDVLIATPGRLLDLMGQGIVSLNQIELFVLDEADRMLDMGFINDVKKVVKSLTVKRQTLLFSATMPNEIQKLSKSILINPKEVAVTPVSSTVEIIEQRLYFVDKGNKKNLLLHVLKDSSIKSVLVFIRAKHSANKLVKYLNSNNIKSDGIHGDKTQNSRQNALEKFKARQIRVLVATDIVARGIDIDDLGHIINYDLPNVAETYVHRIGRTGRAGASGVAISFCDALEKPFLKDIEKLIGKSITVINDNPFPLIDENPPKPVQQQSRKKKRATSICSSFNSYS
jgi:ATP-dependent RNA helicase RhlE